MRKQNFYANFFLLSYFFRTFAKQNVRINHEEANIFFYRTDSLRYNKQ